MMAIPKLFNLLLLSTLTFAFEIPPEIRTSLRKLHDQCIAETGAKLEHLRKCKGLQIPDDPDAKCYLNCILGKFDVNLEDKLAHIENVKHVINDDIHDLVHHLRKECDDKIRKFLFRQRIAM